MWRCPNCHSKVDDSLEVCWSCGATLEGVEDPNFVMADEADPIAIEEFPKGTAVDDPLAGFAATPMPDLVECYMASNTIEARFIADELMEQDIPAIAAWLILRDTVTTQFFSEKRTTMSTATTTTFEVSDVKPATRPLPEVPYKEAIEALLSTGISTADRQFIEEMGRRDKPVPPPSVPVESCTRYHGRLLADVSYHPAVAAIHLAFMNHHPLSLSPDTIWLMFIQGVANHINAHAEELRPKLVRHQGKIKIEVRRDDFVKGSPENPWSDIFNDFSVRIRDHVGPKIDLFMPAFSTTGPVERAASEVVLLDAMQSYFDYELFTGCGIPTIAIEGTQEDWQALAERAQSFEDFGLGSWLELLSPILRQFVRASQGDVDRTFWRSLYKFNSQSGGPVITGWITAFFPYLKDRRTRRASVPSQVLTEEGKSELDEMLYPGEKPKTGWVTGPRIEYLPSGLSKAPFRWEYLERYFDLEFLGGFVGVAQDQESLTLRPEIGWAVRESVPEA